MRFRVWVFISVLLFAAGIVFGQIASGSVASLLGEDIAAIQDLGNFLLSLPGALTALFIFLKNAMALLMGFVFSPLLCIVPILTLTLNGAMLSLVSSLVIQQASVGYVLAGLLPHGVLELPAIIIGEAAAMSFGVLVIMAIFRKESRQQLIPGLKRNLRYLALGIILLVPAAIIETFVTPLLLT